MKSFLFICFMVCLFMGCGHPAGEEPNMEMPDSTVYKLVKEHQILLMNEAVFEGHTGLYGASAFLIKQHDKIYAVTARHLIGEAGGVEPEMMPVELGKYLSSWKMYPRVEQDVTTDTVIIGKQKLDYTSLKQDVLLLPVENTNHHILPLKTNFNLPKLGQKLYIIGCPYSEPDCRQNVYEVTVDSYDLASSTIYCLLKEKLDISGFSGAPLVDGNGSAVGIVVNGGSMEGGHFVGATFITEIQKIK